jgi:TPP-dependent 2-oxoacid decarboxylase
MLAINSFCRGTFAVVLIVLSIAGCSTNDTRDNNTVIHWTNETFTVGDFRTWLSTFRKENVGAIELICGIMKANSPHDRQILTILKESLAIGPEEPVPNARPQFGQVASDKDLRLVADLVYENCQTTG